MISSPSILLLSLYVLFKSLLRDCVENVEGLRETFASSSLFATGFPHLDIFDSLKRTSISTFCEDLLDFPSVNHR